jgi:hypothetical protein
MAFAEVFHSVPAGTLLTFLISCLQYPENKLNWRLGQDGPKTFLREHIAPVEYTTNVPSGT